MVLTAGCNFLTTQETTNIGSTESGINSDLGKIGLRNAMIFTENGDQASLSVTVVNDSKSAETVSFQYDSLGTPTTTSIKVPANSTVARGTLGGQPQILLNGIGARPGTLYKVYVHYGTETGKKVGIPVLDGSLKQYETLLPSPVPTETPTILPTGTATPTP